ncbi:MAG: NUDIX domain-containing protein [Candidatus ainarchaeum sp.]|jgi:8-oxo-dGTP pyrophosphatase MutT (NUDIX family)|nr:NUDIX domain-containing protein [Clostridia bacterium]MDD4251435.1 NUDIX domain-containing protein [Candidatus ainarchaeum sp.]
MEEIKVSLTNGDIVNSINLYEELIYGATGLLIDKDKSKNLDKNVMAINPKSTEKMKIIIKENVGDKAILLIPAHIKEHFDLAKKYGLNIKAVVAPYFLGEGEFTLRPDLPIQNRKSVIAIVKNKVNNTYLCVDSKNRVCKSFVLGGIESGETPEQAALREIEEETGYLNVKVLNISFLTLHNHFFANYKGVNRYSTLNIVFCELINDEKTTLDEKENSEHFVCWIKKEKLMDFLSVPNNKFACKILFDGESAYEGDGKMINSNELNGMTREAAKIFLKN